MEPQEEKTPEEKVKKGLCGKCPCKMGFPFCLICIAIIVVIIYFLFFR